MRVERDTAHQESLAKEVMRTAVSLNTKKYYGHTKRACSVLSSEVSIAKAGQQYS